MATLDELATFIASAASLTVGTNLIKGTIPAEPDVVTVIREYPGTSPSFVFGQSSISTEKPRVQVICRGAREDYVTPRALAETIYRAMAAASAQTISSTRYLAMTPLQSPFPLGLDENARISIAFNVEIEKELSAA